MITYVCGRCRSVNFVKGPCGCCDLGAIWSLEEEVKEVIDTYADLKNKSLFCQCQKPRNASGFCVACQKPIKTYE